jgi:hypothetical protein
MFDEYMRVNVPLQVTVHEIILDLRKGFNFVFVQYRDTASLRVHFKFLSQINSKLLI